MKKSAVLFGISLFLVPTAFANDLEPLSACNWTVWNKWTGETLGSGRGHIRLGQPDMIRLDLDCCDLVLKMEEVEQSPDNVLYELTEGGLTGYVAGKFFYATGKSARFGNTAVFAEVRCSAPRDVPYYFMGTEGPEKLIVILSDDDSDDDLRSFFTQREICVAGDLSAAGDAVGRHWTLSIDNLTVTEGKGLEWDWVKKTCLTYGPFDGHGQDCEEWKTEIEGRRVAIPPCSDVGRLQ